MNKTLGGKNERKIVTKTVKKLRATGRIGNQSLNSKKQHERG